MNDGDGSMNDGEGSMNDGEGFVPLTGEAVRDALEEVARQMRVANIRPWCGRYNKARIPGEMAKVLRQWLVEKCAARLSHDSLFVESGWLEGDEKFVAFVGDLFVVEVGA